MSNYNYLPRGWKSLGFFQGALKLACTSGASALGKRENTRVEFALTER